MSAEIIHRGRGPEIKGTRITVYDVMDYRKHGWHRDRIATFFRLSSGEIQAALDYIAAHEAEVTAEYQRILDRHHNYKYPPDVQAKVDASRGRAAKWLQERRAQRAKKNGDAQDSV